MGGAVRYVEALLRPLADRVRLNCPVERVQRQGEQVVVTPRDREGPRSSMPLCWRRTPINR